MQRSDLLFPRRSDWPQDRYGSGLCPVSYTHLDVYKRQGLYTQRKPGIDGGRTSALPPEELDDEHFMMRIRICLLYTSRCV